MLGIPLADALAAIALPATVSEALLQRSGPLSAVLDLALACETNDDAAFATAADTLKLDSSQVNWAHLQALAWAESLTLA
jgi:EAL and modified HD-GYP domain-containing signal transduction protein